MKLIFAFALLGIASIVSAQDMPSGQLYIGYEFERPNLSVLGVSLPRQSFSGAEVAGVARAYKWVGVEANFAAGYKRYQGTTNLNFFGLAGPRVQYTWGKIQPYGHFLLGAEHVKWDALSYSGTGFALGGGGGLVVNLTAHFGLAGGLDYIHSSKSVSGATVGSNTFRITVGPSFSWGGRTEEPATSVAVPASRPEIVVSRSAVAAPLLGVAVDGSMRIVQFLPDSVLYSHGAALGDIVNSVDGKIVRTPEELNSAMSTFTRGTKIKIGLAVRGMWQTWIEVQL
ncbi:MAG TPA: outer membrane beta-barrel protein [Terriglobia bacterium]|nr:outer membrane beta-barrel protein [Terriglobia bacterium]